MNHTSILLWPLLAYGIAVVSLVAGMLFISNFLGERHEEHATDETYEGGIVATGSARLRFPVHFYVVAMFFVIFDVDSAIIFSWAISIRNAGWTGYITIFIFIAILTIVSIYIYRTGALNFGPAGKKILKAYHNYIKKINPYEVVDKQGQ